MHPGRSPAVQVSVTLRLRRVGHPSLTDRVQNVGRRMEKLFPLESRLSTNAERRNLHVRVAEFVLVHQSLS